MRGTHDSCSVMSVLLGIIPAYAGNTKYGAHFTTGHGGSSPRMRGTHCASETTIPTHGIIPAYAGNTGIEWNDTTSGGDHPRVCGEHSQFTRPIPYELGSSPRMRGTPCDCGDALMLPGIIPAYAGNTRTVFPQPCPARDHPRVCGEHMIRYGTLTLSMGSSPRMRGTPIHKPPCSSNHGIIPAYAGNTN